MKDAQNSNESKQIHKIDMKWKLQFDNDMAVNWFI